MRGTAVGGAVGPSGLFDVLEVEHEGRSFLLEGAAAGVARARRRFDLRGGAGVVALVSSGSEGFTLILRASGWSLNQLDDFLGAAAALDMSLLRRGCGVALEPTRGAAPFGPAHPEGTIEITRPVNVYGSVTLGRLAVAQRTTDGRVEWAIEE